MRPDYAPTSTDNSKVLFIVSRHRLDQTRRDIYDFVEFKFRQLLEEPLHTSFGCPSANEGVDLPPRRTKQSCPSSPTVQSFLRKTRNLTPTAPRDPLIIKKRSLADSSSQRALRFSPPRAERTEAKEPALPDSTLASKGSSARESARKGHSAFELFEQRRIAPAIGPSVRKAEDAMISSLEDFLSLQHFDAAFGEAPRTPEAPPPPDLGAFRRKARGDSLSSSEGELLTDQERALRLNRRLSRRDSAGDGWERRESLLRQTGLAFSFTKSQRAPAERLGRGQRLENPFAR